MAAIEVPEQGFRGGAQRSDRCFRIASDAPQRCPGGALKATQRFLGGASKVTGALRGALGDPSRCLRGALGSRCSAWEMPQKHMVRGASEVPQERWRGLSRASEVP